MPPLKKTLKLTRLPVKKSCEWRVGLGKDTQSRLGSRSDSLANVGESHLLLNSSPAPARLSAPDRHSPLLTANTRQPDPPTNIFLKPTA